MCSIGTAVSNRTEKRLERDVADRSSLGVTVLVGLDIRV